MPVSVWLQQSLLRIDALRFLFWPWKCMEIFSSEPPFWASEVKPIRDKGGSTGCSDLVLASSVVNQVPRVPPMWGRMHMPGRLLGWPESRSVCPCVRLSRLSKPLDDTQPGGPAGRVCPSNRNQAIRFCCRDSEGTLCFVCCGLVLPPPTQCWTLWMLRGGHLLEKLIEVGRRWAPVQDPTYCQRVASGTSHGRGGLPTVQKCQLPGCCTLLPRPELLWETRAEPWRTRWLILCITSTGP